MNMAAVTEQTTEAFDWKLIGFIERGRIHWNLFHSKSMVFYLKFESLIDYCLVSNKPLRDPTMIQFTDAYMRQSASRS